MNKNTKKFQSLWAVSLILSLCLTSAAQADDIAPGVGQTIDDGSGNTFMEEVIDPKQKIKDEIERESAKTNRSIDRHFLSPEELSNVGMQVTKSGSLIPLIRKNATGPVQQNSSSMEVYNEYLPQVYPVAIPNLGPGGYYGNPYSAYQPYSPYNAYQPYMPYSPMYANPYYARPIPNIYQPYPYNPYYSGLGGMQTQIYSSPSYLTNTTSVFSDPSKPGSISVTRDSLMTSPFWQGYATTSPYGTWLGGSLQLPTTTQSTSTTTFTPLIPNFSQ